MKHRIFNSLLLLLLALPALVLAQTPQTPLVYKEWTLIAETPTSLDISYKIIKCGTVNQVHLLLFNESTEDQNANFELEFTNNADGKKFVKVISFATTKAGLYRATCKSDVSLNALKMDLPLWWV